MKQGLGHEGAVVGCCVLVWADLQVGERRDVHKSGVCDETRVQVEHLRATPAAHVRFNVERRRSSTDQRSAKCRSDGQDDAQVRRLLGQFDRWRERPARWRGWIERD